MVQADTIWTLGHSTRSIGEFIALLQHYRLEAVVDVRRFPGSRRLPQYLVSRFYRGNLTYDATKGEPLNAKERSHGIQGHLDL